MDSCFKHLKILDLSYIIMPIIGLDMNHFSVEYFEKNDVSLPVEILIFAKESK